MTPKQYQAARKRLGLTHVALAELLAIHPVTSRDYGTKTAPPETIRRFIVLLEEVGVERARTLIER
jgi:hypothetical protein